MFEDLTLQDLVISPNDGIMLVILMDSFWNKPHPFVLQGPVFTSRKFSFTYLYIFPIYYILCTMLAILIIQNR